MSGFHRGFTLKFRSFTLAFVAVFLIAAPVRADFLRVVGGDTVEDTIDEIDFLIDKFAGRLDDLGEKYTRRLASLVAKSVHLASDEADALREALKRDALDLKTAFFDDISAKIWEAECAAVRLAEGTFQEAIAQAVTRLVDSDPAITLEIFGLEIGRIAGSAQPNNVSVPRPDIVYYRFRNAAIEALVARYERNGKSTPAFAVYSTLLEISQLARQTSCRFPGNDSAEQRFMAEHARFGARATMWDEIVSVQFAE